MILNHRKITFFFLILMILFFALSPCHAKKNTAKELEKAQALLAKGDYDNAFQAYHQFAVEKENPVAQFTMGLFFQLGWGRPVDEAKACKWFEKAGNNGIPAATHFFADCLNKGVGTDPGKAAKWYKRSASLGYHMSLCSLAELYMAGSGVPKDPDKALELCRQAADRRVIPAQIRLARFLMDKNSGRQDLKRAFEWFSMAADMEAPEAQYYLGIMLCDGLGRQKDPETARFWFEKSAVKGYEKAYFPLGELYFNAPRDPENGMLPAADLAKSYLWVSAGKRQVSDADGQKQAELLLKKILEIMPETWKADLDLKVDAHFKSFPPHQP